MSAAAPLAGTEDHAQARVALGAALAGAPSHAYLFHGPAGVGKRVAARAFAAELLAAGAPEPAGVRTRVQHGSHPDLTWVRPTGAHVMRVEDVDGPVVAAATRTPFEAARRVFVLERVDTMNDEVANRLLKTLEEPAPFVHLILLTDALGQVLPTVVSRCQLVRFQALPATRIAAELGAAGVDEEAANACAALALGNLERARYLASEQGAALRSEVQRIVDAALDGSGAAGREPWRGLLDRAREAGEGAQEAVAGERDARLEGEPKGRDRGALERRFDEAAKRDARRAQTGLLELGLTLAALAFRDLVCVAEGAPETALDPTSAARRADVARTRDPRRLLAAAERCEQTRLALALNVSEELALEALVLRLARLGGAPA